MTWHLRDTRQMRGNKFGAKRTVTDGLTFDSKHEAKRWTELRLLEMAGQIQDLQRQVPFELTVNGVKVSRYRPDFVYVVTATGEVITEDAKASPTRTEAYVLRKKLMRACHQIVVTEV